MRSETYGEQPPCGCIIKIEAHITADTAIKNGVNFMYSLNNPRPHNVNSSWTSSSPIALVFF